MLKVMEQRPEYVLPDTPSLPYFQKMLEQRRRGYMFTDNVAVMNKEEVPIRVNQFVFGQQDMRPTLEDSSWGNAEDVFVQHVEKRLKMVSEKTTGLTVENINDVYPFLPRFFIIIDNIKSVTVAENPTPVTNSTSFRERIKSVLAGIRTTLKQQTSSPKRRHLDVKERDMYDVCIWLMTIEYVYPIHTVKGLAKKECLGE